MITQDVYPELELAVHTVTGDLDEAEFLEAASALYALDPVPKRSLWDLSNATVSHVTLDRIRAVQSAAIGYVRGREGGRTAVVAPRDIAFGASRQYVALAESLELPFEQRVFRTSEKALEWLGLDPDCLASPNTPEAVP